MAVTVTMVTVTAARPAPPHVGSARCTHISYGARPREVSAGQGLDFRTGSQTSA